MTVCWNFRIRSGDLSGNPWLDGTALMSWVKMYVPQYDIVCQVEISDEKIALCKDYCKVSRTPFPDIVVAPRFLSEWDMVDIERQQAEIRAKRRHEAV